MAKRYGNKAAKLQPAAVQSLKHTEIEGILLKLNRHERLTLLAAAGIKPHDNEAMWIDQIIIKLTN